jgi:hypothetical protein
MGGGGGNILGELVGIARGVYSAKDAKEAAKKDRARQMALLEGNDWDPMYASDRAPTFQKSESPIARGYLESMLTGNNPDQISRAAPNAAMQKQFAQTNQNQMFGTPQERLARSRELQTATPWKVQSPADEGLTLNDPAPLQAMKTPALSQAGFSPDDSARLKSAIGDDRFSFLDGKVARRPEDAERLQQLVAGGATDEEIRAEYERLHPTKIKVDSADGGLGKKIKGWFT